MAQPILIALTSERIGTGSSGFEALNRLGEEFRRFNNAVIRVDLSAIQEFDLSMAAALRIIVQKAERQENVVLFSRLSDAARASLRISNYFGPPRPFKHVIPLMSFKLNQGIDFSVHAKKQLSRRDMPRLSKSYTELMLETLDELFANASLHSKSLTNVIFSGRYSAKKGRFSLVIADGGIGIPSVINQTLNRKMAAAESINWAMTSPNTTRRGDIPGGLGSKIVREFVRANSGNLTVVSDNGFWREEGSGVIKRTLASPFPGTITLLEVDMRSTSSAYALPQTDPETIW